MRASIMPEWSSRRLAKHPDGDILVIESLATSITGSLSFGNEEFPKGKPFLVFHYYFLSNRFMSNIVVSRLSSEHL